MIDLVSLYKKNLMLWMLISVIGCILLTREIPIFIIEGIIYFIFFIPVYFIFYKLVIRSKNFTISVFIFSLCIKLVFVVLIANYLTVINSMPFLSYNDDYNYEWISSAILKRWESDGIGFYDNIMFSKGFYSGFPNASALAKFLFGDSFYVPRIMNAIFSSLTVVVFYKTLCFFASKNFSKIICFIFCISSLFVFYASFQLKDTILLFLVSSIIYWIGRMLFLNFSIKGVLYITFCSVLLMFFRAATLFPIYLSLIVVFLFVKDRKFTFFVNIKLLASLLLLIVFFIFSWKYLYLSDVLPFDAFSYYDSRTNYDGKEDRMSGSGTISKLGAIALILGPLYMLFSFFLPTPVFVDVFSGSGELNYSFIPLIDYYSLLPIGLVCLTFVLIKLRKNKFFMFLFLFMLLYKLGQAGSMSIFDSRQSLPTIYVFFILLGVIEYDGFHVFYKKYYKFFFACLMLIMIGFSFVRVYLRSGF